MYCLAGSNFDEMTAGNAMKYASCVDNKGVMNFGNVSSFVANAKEAGLTIYGHTLAWHSQQNNKYLNGLIKDKELPPAEENPGLIITAGDPKANTWDYEIYYDLDEPLKAGKTYEISLNVRGTNPGTIDFWPGKKDGSATQYGAGSFTVAESAVDNKFTFTPNADIDRMRFCFGKIGGTLYFDNFVLKEKGSDHNIAVNSTFDEDDISHWTKVSWMTDVSYKIGNVAGAGAVEIPVSVGHLTFDDGQNLGGWGMDNTPKIVNGVCEVGNNAAKENTWNAQVNYQPGFAFENGTTYHLKMKIKGSVAGEFGAGFQNPEGYKGCGDFPTINVTTDWKEVDVATTCNGDNALRLLLNIGKYAGTLYIDDFEVYYTKSSNGIPLTDEEKKDVLTTAMGTWIDGMMAATDGYVTSWDVVNEAISGKKGADGFNELQHATNAPASDVANSFYWQDYLGDIYYVRTAVRDARKSFAEHNGDPSKLKLFINDYNLEGYWDQHAKLNSLIHWIGLWEDPNAEEPVVIDGIGTQMHVTCYGDATKQAKLKSDIEEMFKSLANTGKLIKISELDMAYEDEAGTSVTFDKMTEEQHKQMRSFYTFIIQKYFELIPQAQQYGITQWCATDSPKDSGWRAGCPTGLWDSNYLRKHTYAGFAVGLGAPEYWKENAE